MQNHYYDNTHPLRPYTHSMQAIPGTFPPSNALRGEDAPIARPGFHPAEAGGLWIEIEDHRGTSGYLNGQPHEIKEFGPLPNGWSDTPPPPTPEEIAAKRIATIKSRLSAIDVESIRPLRAIADGSATEADRAKLAALEAEAGALREELGVPAE